MVLLPYIPQTPEPHPLAIDLDAIPGIMAVSLGHHPRERLSQLAWATEDVFAGDAGGVVVECEGHFVVGGVCG